MEQDLSPAECIGISRTVTAYVATRTPPPRLLRPWSIGPICSSASTRRRSSRSTPTAFETLPLKEKTLIWHLYQAALAGRDIFFDQKYAPSLEMRDVLEAIITHPAGVDQATLDEITRYTKLFWINSGPHNNLTARKFVLRMHAGRLRRRGARGRTLRRDVSVEGG